MSTSVVIGARNIDLHIQLETDFTPDKGSTLPCRLRQNLGGVAYNVTRALSLLKARSVRLLTVSGTATSFAINDSTPTLVQQIDNESTATYISLLDSRTSELISGFGDMGIYERQITPPFLDHHLSTLLASEWLMFDANLSQSAIEHLVNIGSKHQKRLVFISAGGPRKACRIVPFLDRIHVLFCNRLEFDAITESTSSSLELRLMNICKQNPNMKLVCVTAGAAGVFVATRTKLRKYAALTTDKEQHQVQNVTGAGDSFAAGVMSQLLISNFDNIDQAIACGLLAAKFTLASANTISEQLQTIDETMIKQICSKHLSYEHLNNVAL